VLNHIYKLGLNMGLCNCCTRCYHKNRTRDHLGSLYK